MKLKRYVKVENGSITDLRQHGRITVCITEENGQHIEMFGIGDNYPKGKITSLGMAIIETADSIFDLTTTDWLCKFKIETVNGYYVSTESIDATAVKYYIKRNEIDNILSIYAPITENGKLIRYELVWEKEVVE